MTHCAPVQTVVGPQQQLDYLRQHAPESSDQALRLCVALAWVTRDQTFSNALFNTCNLVLREARDELMRRGAL